MPGDLPTAGGRNEQRKLRQEHRLLCLSLFITDARRTAKEDGSRCIDFVTC